MLLSLLTLLFTLTSCEKNPENTPEPTTAEILIGSWQESSSTLFLYSNASTKISEEAQPLRKATFNTNGRFDYRYVNEAVLEGSYKLSTSGNKEYIEFKTPDNELTFTIENISAKTLTVSCETHNVTYYLNNKPLIAARSIRRMTLNKF